jgi:hypothetical protein
MLTVAINQVCLLQNNNTKFAFYQSKLMGGVAIFLFSKTKMLNKIKELYVNKVEAGTSGYA